MMQELLNHPAIYALGNALLHSFWQFALIAFIGGSFATIFPSPATKHRVYLLSLSACGLAFAATMLCYYPLSFASTEVLQIAANWPVVDAGINEANEVAKFSFSLAMRVAALGYLFGLFALVLSTFRDLWRAKSIRHSSIAAPEKLRAVFKSLKSEYGLSQSLKLRLNSRVSSALTVGIFRPMVVLPLSLINQLDPAELEAILLHEITHVLRKDHLWNALQTALKILFFYHPLIHWLSRRIDLQREYACDDLVTGQLDRQLYAQSLLRVAQFSISHKNRFVMQAQGKSAFTNRLQRLFHQPSNRRANNRNRWLLLPLLMLPLLLTAALAAQRNEPSAVRETTSTTAENAETALYFLDDQRYPSMESLQLKLGPNAYLQACGEADEELKRINAAEAAGYTTIMRFYNGGVPLDDGHTGIFEQINPTEEETMETETFYNGERLDASGEQAMVAGIMVAQSENSAGLNMAYFIDDVPVNGSLDENDAITVTGSVLHYDNEASAVTKALNQRQNTQYDGVVKMDTAEEGAAVTQNAAMAIQANDSILYLVNDVPYEQLDISRIPPEAIEIINVKKQVNYPSGALDKKYLGVVEIRLKPGYDMEDFLRKIEPGKQGRSEVELRHEKDLQDMFGGKLEFSNIVLFVDGERRKTADIQKLKAEGIESVEVIKDAKQLKALGFQEYEAVIKIFTLKGKQ